MDYRVRGSRLLRCGLGSKWRGWAIAHFCLFFGVDRRYQGRMLDLRIFRYSKYGSLRILTGQNSPYF